MKKSNSSSKIFNLKLFKKLMVFVKPYSFYYRLVLIAAVLLSIFSIITPYLLKIIVDDYIRLKDYDGMKIIILFMFISLIFTVFFQILFVYFANFLGQKVIKDLRVKLFNNIINFKLDYFKNTPIGRLVTRTVNDIETIASIFSQGLFMIIADLFIGFYSGIIWVYGSILLCGLLSQYFQKFKNYKLQLGIMAILSPDIFCNYKFYCLAFC